MPDPGPITRASLGERLPELPLEEWKDTKDTLQLYVQMVGKIRLASTAPKNHWWHCPLYVSARGLTTRRMRFGERSFQIDFDFIDHELVIRADRGDREALPLHDGLSVADFCGQLFGLLAKVGIEPAVRLEPYGIATTTPFPDDSDHASYDRNYVERFWRILLEVDWILDEFAGWFSGKSSPVHLFWHGFDLAVTRFSGRRAPGPAAADPVSREAYTHEVISFGFWAGDDKVAAPAFYSYTSPEPPGLTDEPLRPEEAFWRRTNGSHQAMLWYEDFRTSESPRDTLLAFLQSAYEAGAKTAGWDEDELAASWAPRVDEPRERFGRRGR